ncbi:hypothetical protein [Pseudoneobacillus sp. C159]
MKKLVIILGGFVMAFGLMFVSAGNSVLAHEGDDCGCPNVEMIVGAEKNKMVAELLKSNGFKDFKKSLMENGYSYRGVHDIEVANFIDYGFIAIAVPFINKDGAVEMKVFVDGVYMEFAPI